MHELDKVNQSKKSARAILGKIRESYDRGIMNTLIGGCFAFFVVLVALCVQEKATTWCSNCFKVDNAIPRQFFYVVVTGLSCIGTVCVSIAITLAVEKKEVHALRERVVTEAAEIRERVFQNTLTKNVEEFGILGIAPGRSHVFANDSSVLCRRYEIQSWDKFFGRSISSRDVPST